MAWKGTSQEIMNINLINEDGPLFKEASVIGSVDLQGIFTQTC